MHDTWTHELETWHEFFLLIGTAGVTLTGLLFVVVSLGPRVVANHHATGVRAFISPNAVFFTTTLVVSALLMIPNVPAKVIGSFLFQAVFSIHLVAGVLLLLLVIGIRNAWDLVIWISRREHK